MTGAKCQTCHTQKRLKNRMVEITSPRGKVWRVTGYETKYLEHQIDAGVADDDIEASFDGNVPSLSYRVGEDTSNPSIQWYPDFWLPKQQTMVEVKSVWTYSVNAETTYWKMVHCPYKCELWVYSPTNIVEVVTWSPSDRSFSYRYGEQFVIGQPFESHRKHVEKVRSTGKYKSVESVQELRPATTDDSNGDIGELLG